MTVLVTGGAGFVGAEVVRTLLEAGAERPVVFDISSFALRLDGVHDQVELLQRGLGESSQVLNVVKTVRPGVIYHLGGMLSVPSDADPAVALRANALGTYRGVGGGQAIRRAAGAVLQQYRHLRAEHPRRIR